MPLKICLLTDQDLDADPFPKDDWPCDPRPHLPEASWTLLTLRKESCVSEVTRAADRGFDLFFNLCDGAWDEGRVGIEVVQTLERLGVPFTGADPAFFEPSREAMKRVCHAWGIHTPAYRFAGNDDEIAEAAEALRFPLFVKHPSSYASHSLTRDSRVETPETLFEQARRMIGLFGSTLIEEYIAGVECTSLVVENAEDPDDPIVYPPLRYRFPEGESFKHYDLKWVDYDGLESFPVEDEELARRIRTVSARFFRGIRGTSYGRCDMRIDDQGRIFMLEINPNCGLFYPPSAPASADLILMSHPGGHELFVRRVVAAALARHRRRSKSWRVRPRRDGDYGSFANRHIDAGETIFAWEEQPHNLVTRTHVETHWDAVHREWFDRYAWPLTEEVWVTWSSDPEEWRHLNHSCDPNAWLDGLDVVARRPIGPGEEITMDYATFNDERMPAFECSCRAERCRKVIRGDDYLLNVMDRYEGHFSDHVRRRRRRPESSVQVELAGGARA